MKMFYTDAWNQLLLRLFSLIKKSLVIGHIYRHSMSQFYENA